MKKKRINKIGKIVIIDAKKESTSHGRVFCSRSYRRSFQSYYRNFDEGMQDPAVKVSVYAPQKHQPSVKDKILEIIIKKNMDFNEEEKIQIKSLYDEKNFNDLLEFLESLSEIQKKDLSETQKKD